MQSNFEKYKDYFIILIITIIAAILRFYNCIEMSFSNDELSAISRLEYNSFTDLINFGVKLDGHPAGVQVFLYYWTYIFGKSVFAIRFPFIVAGILSIPVFYLIAKQWFNKQSALISVSALAFLEYSIFYSQLSRPYSIGLFITLINLYFWSKIFIEKKSNGYNALLYGFSIALAAYTHYFSFLAVIFIALASFFYISKKNFKSFILSIAFSVLLYLPHYSIFKYQLSVGGVGWLSKPDFNWIIDYFSYCFNDSKIVISIIFIVFITSVFLYIKNKTKLKKIQFISLGLFILPLITGYIYSLYKTPILQYSVLIFSFPFLLLFLFSFIENIKTKIFNVFLGVFSLALILSTIIENRYYTKEHFGEFKKIAKKLNQWNNQYGNINISYAINVNKEYYFNYYLDNYNDSINFKISKFEGRDDFKNLITILKTSETKYFAYAWSNKYNPLEITEIIKLYFPYLIEFKNHFNSEVFLFSKDSVNHTINYEKSYSIHENFDNNITTRNIRNNLDSTTFFNKPTSFRFTKGIEYGPTTELIDSNLTNNYYRILVKLKFKKLPEEKSFDPCLVISIDDKNNILKLWSCMDFKYFTSIENDWNDLVYLYQLPKDYNKEKGDKIKIYTWNRSFNEFNIDAVEIEFITNPLHHLPE